MHLCAGGEIRWAPSPQKLVVPLRVHEGQQERACKPVFSSRASCPHPVLPRLLVPLPKSDTPLGQQMRISVLLRDGRAWAPSVPPEPLSLLRPIMSQTVRLSVSRSKTASLTLCSFQWLFGPLQSCELVPFCVRRGCPGLGVRPSPDPRSPSPCRYARQKRFGAQSFKLPLTPPDEARGLHPSHSGRPWAHVLLVGQSAKAVDVGASTSSRPPGSYLLLCFRIPKKNLYTL